MGLWRISPRTLKTKRPCLFHYPPGLLKHADPVLHCGDAELTGNDPERLVGKRQCVGIGPLPCDARHARFT